MPINTPLVVDGPNFINRLLDLGIAPVHLSRQLSLRGLVNYLNIQLAELPDPISPCISAEFVCSPKKFGSGSRKFAQEHQDSMLNRFRSEIGVFVDVVNIPGSSEKGVDTTIAGKLEDYASHSDAIILASADRDYIPTLHRLRRKTRILLVSVKGDPPIDLQNEAYTTLTIGDDVAHLFTYSYPRYHIDDLNAETCAVLYSESDNRILNQLRVDGDGTVYISKDYVGSANLDGVRFRFETWASHTGYTGPLAASDQEYISRELANIKKAWSMERKGYIDWLP